MTVPIIRRADDTHRAICIEPMMPRDLDAVVAMESAVSNPAWSRLMFETELTKNHFATFLVARGVMSRGESDVLCGYAGFWMIFEELHLLNMVVHPDWRRRGIGTRLVQTACEQAFSLGVESVLLEVRESNHAARQFYETLGFAVVARRSGYYERPKEDALMMKYEMVEAACPPSGPQSFPTRLEQNKEGSMASLYDQMTETLRRENRQFRVLESRHQELSVQLDQLIRHHVLTPGEEVLKKQLQKQKLSTKDQLTLMIRRHEEAVQSNGDARRRRSTPSASAGPS